MAGAWALSLMDALRVFHSLRLISSQTSTGVGQGRAIS